MRSLGWGLTWACAVHVLFGLFPLAQGAQGMPILEIAAFAVAPVVDQPVPRPKADARDDRFGGLAERSEGGSHGQSAVRVLTGESWAHLIGRASDALAAGWLKGKEIVRRAALLPELLPGKYVSVRTDPARKLVEVDYVVQPDQAYSIYLHPTSLEVRPRNSDPAFVAKMRADASKASLFTATDAIGLPDGLVLQLVDIFSDQIDFHRELHSGYRCALVYEPVYREGHIEGAGRIIAAQFEVGNRKLQAYYFDDGKGHAGYFSEDGKSLKKAFRQSPIQFSRITSGYTLARFHPVLGVWRAHRGTDYAAPAGTPVVATADGVVRHAGPQGAFGNLVILQHEGGYATYYAHLQGFADKVAVETVIRKGEILGYVGMTGLATGPHLHYEFRVPGALGAWKSVPPRDREEAVTVASEAYFDAIRPYRAQLRLARETQLVMLD